MASDTQKQLTGVSRCVQSQTIANQMSLAGSERRQPKLRRATRPGYPGRAGLIAGSQAPWKSPSIGVSASKFCREFRTHTHIHKHCSTYISSPLSGNDFTPHVGGELSLWWQTNIPTAKPPRSRKSSFGSPEIQVFPLSIPI